MENNENQTRKSKTKNSTKPKTEKEEALKTSYLEMALYYSFGSEYSWSCVYCHSRD